MVVPSWIAGDWSTALRIAGLGQLLLLVGGAAVTVVVLVARMAEAGLDVLDWGVIALSPVLVAVTWSGAGEGAPLLVTGAVYTYLAYRVAAQQSGPAVAALLSSRPRAFAAAAKVGVLAAGILLVVGILLNVFAEDLVGQPAGPWVVTTAVDLTSLVFFALIVGAVAGLFALLAVGRRSLLELLGLRLSVPRLVVHGTLGARRTLVVAVVGLLTLHTLGTLLDRLGQDGVGPGDAVAILLSTLAALLVIWLDLALVLLLGTSKFLHDGGYLWGVFEAGGWMWLSVPVLLGAYLAGGVQVARSARPPTQAEAARAALLVGPGVAIAGLIVAIGWAGQGFIEDIVPVAILLPTLWGVVAMIGAWLWANQQGLTSGLVIERPEKPSDPGARPPEGIEPPPAGRWPRPDGGAEPAAGPPPEPPTEEVPARPGTDEAPTRPQGQPASPGGSTRPLPQQPPAGPDEHPEAGPSDPAPPDEDDPPPAPPGAGAHER